MYFKVVAWWLRQEDNAMIFRLVTEASFVVPNSAASSDPDAALIMRPLYLDALGSGLLSALLRWAEADAARVYAQVGHSCDSFCSPTPCVWC